MRLSFVIPVYKTPEQLLRNCLDSVLRYSQPMELICVLDSPGDPCEQVLDEYAAKEPRMRLLKNDQNRGVSYSRNRGMDAARGDYLAFVDADDEIIAETYEKAAALAVEKRWMDAHLRRANQTLRVMASSMASRLSGRLRIAQLPRCWHAAILWQYSQWCCGADCW